MDERKSNQSRPEPKKRGVAASYPYGEVELRVGQVCRHRKYDYTCVIYGWDTMCKASRVITEKFFKFLIFHIAELDLSDGS